MEPFLGQIQAFGFSYAPKGWMLCQGQLLPIQSNTALFSLLGNTYGGDGKTTFALPDLRGRSPVGMGQGNGLTSIAQGEMDGNEIVTLTDVNIPPHTHPATATSTLYAEGLPGTANNPQGKMLGGIPNGYIAQDTTQDKALDPAAIKTSVEVKENTEATDSFNIRSPFLGLNYSIAVQGIFPPRD